MIKLLNNSEKMSTATVCRVCLDGNVAMRCIKNTELLEIYEKLTNTILDAAGKPKTICFICYSQLQRCYTFSKLSRKSELILNSMLNSAYEVTNETVDKLNYGNGMKKKFTVNVLLYTVLPPPQMNQLYEEATIDVAVKEEFIDAEEQTFADDKIDDSLKKIENFHAKIEVLKIDNNIEVNKQLWDRCTKNITESKQGKHIAEKFGDKQSSNRIDSTVYTKKQIKRKPYYPCSECNETFTNKKTYARHFRTHTTKNLPVSKPLNCDICIKTFTIRKSFNIHMRKHARGRTFICDMCFKAFQTKHNLSRHMQIHTGDKPFSCDECGMKFSQKIHLKGHILNGHTMIGYSCNICHKIFKQKNYLEDHLHTHEIKPMCNKSCDKSFSQSGMFNVKEQKPNFSEVKRQVTNRRIFICNYCDKSFHYKCLLIVHIRDHTGEKRPTCVCEICNKTYVDKNALSRHMKLHTGDRQYACDMCDKTYIQKGGLKKHLLSHLKIKEKICICYICGKTFKKAKLLYIHMHIHSRKLVCDICAKTFSNKETLKTHLRVHTGEKPYKCKFCKKKFNTRCSLNGHLRLHTGGKPFACDKCVKTFAQKNSLDYHTRKRHRP